MCIPIQYALTYPDRMASPAKSLDLARLAQEPFARVAPEPLRGLRASFAARLAAARPETYVSADALRPLYLRAPQAERARNARLGLAGEEESHGG